MVETKVSLTQDAESFCFKYRFIIMLQIPNTSGDFSCEFADGKILYKRLAV